jgi:tRNA A-37 threonylcarbamoyl transferase component Bud32
MADESTIRMREGAGYPERATVFTPSPAMTTPVGESRAPFKNFGNYVILGKLGEGGMGAVYSARDTRLDKVVALKMIRSGQFAASVDIERLKSEANAMAQLDHPNIVPVFEVGEHEGQHYFSMRCIEGTDLAHALAEKTMARRDLVALLVTVARAVQHAHDRGVLHRDLKPSNILLDSQGQPHVTDFGLAKVIDSQRDLTLTGCIFGTPSYMSPEAASGRGKQLTIASDIYGLGAILYRCLAGRPPFDANSIPETLHQVMSEDPVPLRRIHKDIDLDLEVICLHCLRKAPEERYRSAEALADELQLWLEGKPIETRKAPWHERGIKWVRRHPMKVGLIGVLGVALALGCVAVQQRNLAGKSKAAERFQQIENHFSRGEFQSGLAALSNWLREEPGNPDPHEQVLHRLRGTALLVPDPRLKAPPSSAEEIRWAPDGKLAISRMEDPMGFRISDREGRQPISVPQAHEGVIRSLAWSRSGHIVSASDDHWVKVWNSRGDKVAQLDCGEPLTCAELHPSNEDLLLVAHGGQGRREARIWSLAQKTRIGPGMSHENEVTAARFSPDGELILTSSQDSTVCLWEAKTAKAFGHPLRLSTFVLDAGFASDGSSVWIEEDQKGRTVARILKPLQFDIPRRPSNPYPNWLPGLLDLIAGQCPDGRGDLRPIQSKDFESFEETLSKNLQPHPLTRWAQEIAGP